MGYEIDFMAVGNGEKSGDAIAFRFGDLFSPERDKQIIFVIDGGTNESGENLCQHIQQHYGTDKIDYVLCTHPDADHASGLSVVLEKMDVGALLMHLPWEHSEDIKNDFKREITERGLERKLKKELQHAHELHKIAGKKGIEIIQPFAGDSGNWDFGQLHILGPHEDYYKELLPHFRAAPDAKEPVLGSENSSPNFFASVLDKATTWVDDKFHIETLKDGMPDGRFSGENSSSAIFLFTIDGHQILFTGDADEEALHKAIDHSAGLGIDLSNLIFFQVPHHGSRHNVGPAVLNRILGEKQLENVYRNGVAYISASQNASPKHPHQTVINAIHRRGIRPFATQGKAICQSHNAPQREGWTPIDHLPLIERFKDE